MGRLKILDHFDSPVREASGLCCFTCDGQEYLAVVGDRSNTIAWAPVADDGPGDWRELVLDDLAGLPPETGQLEAVADAGGGRLVVMGEEPAILVLVDVLAAQVQGWWHITTSGDSDFAQLWDREENSRGEGLVLLADGHALVIKEKNPVVIIEIGPGGDRRSLDHVSAPTRWDVPPGNDLPVVHWVEIPSAPADVSDCEVVGGVIYALSDQDRSLVVLGHDQESFDITDRWDLDKKIEKPEGLAVTSTGDWYIAMDTRDGRDAIVRIQSPLK